MYVAQRLSSVEIGKIFGVCPSRICDLLKDFNLTRRDLSEAHLSEGVRKISKEELERKYFNERMTAKEKMSYIAKLWKDQKSGEKVEEEESEITLASEPEPVAKKSAAKTSSTKKSK
jgi:ABC-type Na+ transport system ATPase subunit NatA